MRSVEYRNVVYSNGLYGIKKSLRHKIQDKTMECLRNKRMGRRRRKVGKMELIIKISVVLGLMFMIGMLYFG